MRQALGVIKCNAAIKHIRNMMEEKDKIVVFLWHKSVADALMNEFGGAAVRYTGGESAKEKENAIVKFQTENNVRLFIGNIQSAGFGIDGLQSICDTAVFVEMSYVPNEIRQAIDRLNRMGQKSRVQIQFLVAEKSVDEDLINTLADKAFNINTIMNEEKEVAFVETKCRMCGETKEIKNLKRVAKIAVCSDCKIEMECVL